MLDGSQHMGRHEFELRFEFFAWCCSKCIPINCAFEYEVLNIFLQFQGIIKRLVHITTMMGTFPDGQRYGFIQIGNKAYNELELGDATNLRETVKALLNIEYTGEENHNLPDAMEMMIDMFNRS